MWSALNFLVSRNIRNSDRKNQRRPAQPVGTSRRLQLESLEDRCLLSTFTVLNLDDSGPGSLREAVYAANASPGLDTIDFATTGTIPLTSGQLDITDSLTINGPGESALTISGEWLSRVFGIAGDPTVLITGLTIANGWTSDSPGGGLTMAGSNVTLANCTLYGNSVGGGYASGRDAEGGGLYVAGGTLTLDHVIVSANTAAGDSGGVYYYEFDDYTQADGGPGGQGKGGGLYIAGGNVYVNQSTISDNLAIGGNGGDPSEFYWWADVSGPGFGGDAAGGGIYVAGGSLQVRQSTLSGNEAVGGSGGWPDLYPHMAGVSEGGGLYIATAEPPIADLDTFTVSNTTNNFAYYDPNIAGPYFLDGMSRLSIGDATVLEGNDGTTAIVFTVTRSGPSGQAVSVEYATADGEATSPGDYIATSGTLMIPAGQTTETIVVWVNGDRLGEQNQTFDVNLSSPTNATIADGQGVGTIHDDEPHISISDFFKAEGKKGKTTLFTFTVTLSTAYDQAITMSYRTLDGAAKTSDGDYIAKTGTLTFAPGETTKTITIQVKGDNKREVNEVFYVELFGLSSNALFTKNRGIGTILNDD